MNIKKAATVEEMENICFINIWGHYNYCKNVIMTNFNPKDKGHLMVLKTANRVKAVYSTPTISVDLNLFQRLLLKRRTGVMTLNSQKQIKKSEKQIVPICVPAFIDFMEQANDLKDAFKQLYTKQEEEGK